MKGGRKRVVQSEEGGGGGGGEKEKKRGGAGEQIVESEGLGEKKEEENGDEEEEDEEEDEGEGEEEGKEEENDEGKEEERSKLDDGFYEIEAIRRKRVRKVGFFTVFFGLFGGYLSLEPNRREKGENGFFCIQILGCQMGFLNFFMLFLVSVICEKPKEMRQL